jgi:transposase-like protein
MDTMVFCCPFCQSENIVRNGHSPNGKQKYRCRDCQRQTRANPSPYGYSQEEKARILRAYDEHKSSLRGLKRIFGVERNTVSKWIKQRQEQSPGDLPDRSDSPQRHLHVP